MAKQLQGMQENPQELVTMSEGRTAATKRRELPNFPANSSASSVNSGGSEPSPERGERCGDRKGEQGHQADCRDEKYDDLILQDVVWVSPRLDITEKSSKALSEAK